MSICFTHRLFLIINLSYRLMFLHRSGIVGYLTMVDILYTLYLRNLMFQLKINFFVFYITIAVFLSERLLQYYQQSNLPVFTTEEGIKTIKDSPNSAIHNIISYFATSFIVVVTKKFNVRRYYRFFFINNLYEIYFL